MNNYIGIKLIKAEPMSEIDSMIEKTGKAPIGYKNREGYKVKYPDGYESWSPKEVFEKAYMKVTPNPNLKTDISISQEMVDSFIKNKEVQTIGDKTTFVKATLVNGFELCETSSCVDKNNYDQKIGAEICMKKIKDKIWFLLGFLLQTAVGGVK